MASLRYMIAGRYLGWRCDNPSVGSQQTHAQTVSVVAVASSPGHSGAWHCPCPLPLLLSRARRTLHLEAAVVLCSNVESLSLTRYHLETHLGSKSSNCSILHACIFNLPVYLLPLISQKYQSIFPELVNYGCHFIVGRTSNLQTCKFKLRM